MSVNFALLCRNFSFTMHNLIFFHVKFRSCVASERDCLCHPKWVMGMRKLPGIPIETLISFLLESIQATNSG